MASIIHFLCNPFKSLLILFTLCMILDMTRAANTVFLSSFTAMNAMPHFCQVIQNSFDIKHMVYVPTASYCLDPKSPRPMGEQRRRARYDAKKKAALLAQSLSAEDFSLLELDSIDITEDKIVKKMSSASIIYVDGGNTFYLQKYIIQTSFWNAVQPFLDKGGLYIGASAGAIVAGRSIRTAEWKGWDDPTIAGEDYEWNEERLTGRGLRDYRSEVHADLVEKKSVDLDHSVKVVRDDMALIHFENMNNDRINGSDTIANDNYNNDNYNNDDDNNDDIINIDINKNIRVKQNNTKVFSLQADGINF